MSTPTLTELSLPAPFRWEGPLLAATLRGAEVRFTTRAGGVSTGPFATLDLARYADGRESAVTQNMERLAALVGIPVARWAQSRQVHGTHVRRVVGEADLGEDGNVADGQALTLAAAAGVVLTADCLPVVVAGAGGIAVLHGGWRGLAEGVLEAGVRALRDLGEHGRLEAVIGPGAGGCCYEVGPEVRVAFAADGVLARGHAGPASAIDLKAVAARRLHAAGVAAVHDCDLCTMCDTGPDGARRFFSHRADGGVTGRQAGIAWRS